MLRRVNIHLPRCPLCKKPLSPGILYDELSGCYRLGWMCECPLEESLDFLEDLGFQADYAGTILSPSTDVENPI